MLPLMLPLLLACADPSPPPAPRAPNVVLFTLDTLRADALGVYGNRKASTPHLDRLAREGVRFTRAYTVTPLTIPAHSSVHTGLLPPRHGVRDNGDFYLSDDAVTLAERLGAAGYATMASVGAEVTSRHWGFGQGFSAFYDDMGEVDTENRWRVERRGDAVVNDALGWLEGQKGKSEPWFAWIHLFDAHHPYAPPEPYATLNGLQPYMGEVSFLDAQVGRVLDWLGPAIEDTLVIAVADHGEGFGSHGEAMHGMLLYNATTQIPYIVRAPGGGRGTKVAMPVSLVDLVPTVLGFTRQPAAEGIDGVDLGPWLTPTPAPDNDRAVYMESLYPWRHFGWASQRAMVTPAHKLIDSTTPELYTPDDVFETRNQAPTDAETTRRLQGIVAERFGTLTPAFTATAATDERTAQLQALGYVTGTVSGPGDGFGQGLPDPVQHLSSLRDLEQARAALQRGELAQAKEALARLVAAEPGLVEARSLQAGILAREGKPEEALAAYQALDAEHPSATTRAMMGQILLRLGRTGEAAARYGAAVEMDPNLEQAWSGFLLTLLLSKQPVELENALEAARARFPDLPAIPAVEGASRLARGDFDAAEPLFLEAVRRDPLQPLAHEGLGMIAHRRGDDVRAEAELIEELRMNPRSVTARRTLIEIYASQQRYPDQIGQLQHVLRAEPKHIPSVLSLAQALYNLGKYEEARVQVDRCLNLKPDQPACTMLQANVLNRLGQPEQARAAYERALALAGQAPPEAAVEPGSSPTPAPSPERPKP